MLTERRYETKRMRMYEKIGEMWEEKKIERKQKQNKHENKI